MLKEDKIKLLYIEDDESNAEIVAEFLKTSKHPEIAIVHRTTLKDGLDYLNNECFIPESEGIDLILLDLMLPNSHGVATYESISSKCPDIPVVIMSAHEDIACQCIKRGAQDYLIKPFVEKGTLTRAVKYAIERDKLEKSKIESERKYRQILGSAPIGFHNYQLVDDELIFLGGNPASDKILNINHVDLIGKRIEDAFPNLAETEIPKRYIEVAKTGEDWSSEFIEYEDDNIKKGYYRVNVFRTSLDHITVSFEDITQQTIMKRKYQNLVEVSKAGIYEIDFISKKFLYVNDVMCNQLGYTREELMKIGPFKILTDESVRKWLSRWEALKRGEFIDNTFEYEAIRKDGSRMWALITAEFVEDKNKNIIGANVVAIDITDRKIMEMEAKQKEEYVFSEIENRIDLWKDEITTTHMENTLRLQSLNDRLLAVTNSEVQ